jgi:NAD-dependent deacetylase
MRNDISELREIITNSKSVTVLTGAGISAESGVPTFRGADGIWQNRRATDLATPEAFARDPELVWEFYNWRRDLLSKVSFNDGHKALVTLENHVENFTLITQNVDGLHRLAGTRHLLEIHGNMWEVRCTKCGMLTMDRSPSMGALPRCSQCDGLLRPNVVWFGESLDPDILGKAFEAARTCDVMLIVGTSGIVQPAASLSFHAKQGGATIAEINLEKTPQSGHMDFVFTGKAGELLPILVEGMG